MLMRYATALELSHRLQIRMLVRRIHCALRGACPDSSRLQLAKLIANKIIEDLLPSEWRTGNAFLSVRGSLALERNSVGRLSDGSNPVALLGKSLQLRWGFAASFVSASSVLTSWSSYWLTTRIARWRKPTCFVATG